MIESKYTAARKQMSGAKNVFGARDSVDYPELRAGIIEQAKYDYVKALKKSKEMGFYPNEYGEIFNNKFRKEKKLVYDMAYKYSWYLASLKTNRERHGISYPEFWLELIKRWFNEKRDMSKKQYDLVKEIEDLEAFFYSDWCEQLAGFEFSPEDLLTSLQDSVFAMPSVH